MYNRQLLLPYLETRMANTDVLRYRVVIGEPVSLINLCTKFQDRELELRQVPLKSKNF